MKAIDYMSEVAVAALIVTPDTSTQKGLRDRFFMILLYDTGAWVQEMLDMKLCDFRYGKTPTVTIHGKGGKVRTVPLMVKTMEHLRQYLNSFHPEPQDSEQYLFYSKIHEQRKPMTDRRIRYLLTEYGVKAQKTCVEVPQNVHPHLFRHSRAMHLYQHGMDLTLVYAHADTEHKRRAIEAATSNGGSPAIISVKRYTVSDDDTLKRLTGLR